jgi:hypothetical protein
MADTQEPTTSCTHNNTQDTTKNIKHRHHGPPKPPASSGSNFIDECDCCTLHNLSRSLQHGDITFINKTNCSVILFTIILQAMARRTHGQKVSFICYYLCFFLCNCIRTMRTNLLSRDILFANTPRVIIMFQHDFGQGGGCHCHDVFRRRGRLRLLLAWGYLLV